MRRNLMKTILEDTKKEVGFNLSQMGYGGAPYYYVHFTTKNDGNFVLDDSLANLLGMSTEEYLKLAYSFNATTFKPGAVFKHRQDAIDFINYLNDTYLVMLSFMGKI